jgi:hypothetical protein
VAARMVMASGRAHTLRSWSSPRTSASALGVERTPLRDDPSNGYGNSDLGRPLGQRVVESTPGG